MMPLAPDAPLSLRLKARVGPEIVALLLVGVVIVVGAGVALGAGRPSGSTVAVASASPSATVASSATAQPATAPPATAAPSATALPSASVAPSGEPSQQPPTPDSNPAARTALALVDRMLLRRGDLAAEYGRRTTSAPTIAELLRDLNTSLVLIDPLIVHIARDPSTGDLAARLQAASDATYEAVRQTQRASIRNARAYRDGAGRVVATLEPLVGIRVELAALAGGP